MYLILSHAVFENATVVLFAQVFNGVLLPYFSSHLLICLNDPRFMKRKPQTGFLNIALLLSVFCTTLLASSVAISKTKLVLGGWIILVALIPTSIYMAVLLLKKNKELLHQISTSVMKRFF